MLCVKGNSMFDKSLYKAAAFDLDGTLLDRGKMSEGVKEALIKLKNIITIPSLMYQEHVLLIWYMKRMAI